MEAKSLWLTVMCRCGREDEWMSVDSVKKMGPRPSDGPSN